MIIPSLRIRRQHEQNYNSYECKRMKMVHTIFRVGKTIFSFRFEFLTAGRAQTNCLPASDRYKNRRDASTSYAHPAIP